MAHCVAPELRRQWLRTLLSMSFFATMGRMDGPLGELATMMRRSGADLSIEERLSGIDLETLPDTLLSRVKDPAALLAGYIAWGAKYGNATDPAAGIQNPEKLTVIAAEPGKSLVDSIAEAPPSGGGGLQVNISGPAGLPRVLQALAAGGPPAEQRYREEGGIWYLGE